MPTDKPTLNPDGPLLHTFDPAFFDEAFFRGQKGAKRDEDSQTYRELAELMVSLFGGQRFRFLDIGCGRGFVVRRMREAAEDVQGIDVSRWAMDNPVTDGLYERDVRTLPNEVSSLGGPWDVLIADRIIEYLPIEAVGPTLHGLLACGDRLYMGLISTDHARYQDFPLADHAAWGRRTFRPRSWWERTAAEAGWIIDEARHALLRELKPDWLDSWVLRHPSCMG